MGFRKPKPEVISYRNCKNFDNENFQSDINTYRFDKNDVNIFKETILSVFNKYSSVKKKYIRAN